MSDLSEAGFSPVYGILVIIITVTFAFIVGTFVVGLDTSESEYDVSNRDALLDIKDVSVVFEQVSDERGQTNVVAIVQDTASVTQQYQLQYRVRTSDGTMNRYVSELNMNQHVDILEFVVGDEMAGCLSDGDVVQVRVLIGETAYTIGEYTVIS